jgi:hypothetical protein
MLRENLLHLHPLRSVFCINYDVISKKEYFCENIKVNVQVNKKGKICRNLHLELDEIKWLSLSHSLTLHTPSTWMPNK